MEIFPNFQKKSLIEQFPLRINKHDFQIKNQGKIIDFFQI